MICKNCGSNIPDGTKFCTKCGSRVMAEPAVNADFSASQQPMNSVPFGAEAIAPAAKKSSAKKVIIPVVALILVAALAVGAYFIFFASGYKKSLNDYFKAVETQDADLLKDSMPEFMNEIMKLYSAFGGESASDAAYEEMAKSQHAYFASWVDNAEDIKISYKVVSEEEESKEDLDKELEQLKAFGIDLEIEEAYELELEVTVKGDGKEETKEVKAAAFKEKDRWSVFVDAGSAGIF